eukprot:g29727.t1
MPRVRAGKGEEGNVARKAKRRRKKRDAVVAGLTELVDEAQGISKEDLEEGQTMINEMGEQWGKVGATGEDRRHRAYQLLLYCDTAGHSDRQTKQLLRLVKHPFLTSSLLLKHKKTVTETVVEQFRLKELLNNLQSLFYFKRNSRRASWMEELLTAHYRARYLSLFLKEATGWQLQQWKFECKSCGKRYFYEGCYDKHVAACRHSDYDFSDVLIGLEFDRPI